MLQLRVVKSFFIKVALVSSVLVASNAFAAEDVPSHLRVLQDIVKVKPNRGIAGDGADNLGDPEANFALDLRRDAQREAALSYGARGGLARRGYEIMERLSGRESVLDGVFDFRQLLIKAPSGMLIEPPIINEAGDALIITNKGVEAAVADKVYDIRAEAKIVTAPKNWRQYLEQNWGDVLPPPKVLWPENEAEQARWSAWVEQGWEAGYGQADQIFESNLNRLVADFNGMVRYRILVAQGMVSVPFALHEDRGITGGGRKMRIGDRALRITGPSQFRIEAKEWNPADR